MYSVIYGHDYSKKDIRMVSHDKFLWPSLPCFHTLWYILLWAGGRWREWPLGGEVYAVSHRSPQNYSPSLQITPKPAGRLIDCETPISRPRGVGLIVEIPIYLNNHSVLATGDSRPRHVFLEPGHATDCGRVPTSDYQLRVGCSRAETAKAVPARINELLSGKKPRLNSDPDHAGPNKERTETSWEHF